MIGSTALVSKTFFAVLILSIVYFIAMDILLYIRIRDYDVRPTLNGTTYHSALPCELNPICTVTVKGLMLDYPNHYILTPSAVLIDNLLNISRCWTWVTPNIISFTHIFVAIVAGRCVSSDSLAYRRLGVLLFQLRTLMDDLDGRVARKRANILGERSDVGSTGYLIDGTCDALGCLAFIVGLFCFLSRHPAKRSGYDKLQQLPLVSSGNPDSVYSTVKSSPRVKAFRSMLIVVGHLIVISFAWNRYISLYQDLLETDVKLPAISSEQLYARQTRVFRSEQFWSIALCWKMVNFHAVMDYILLAVFVDRVWEYTRLTKWSAFVVTLLLVYVTEFHFTHAYSYVHGLPSSAEVEGTPRTH